MADTKIEWTSKSWNPLSGCTKISPGCQFCYAERMSKRLAGRFGYPKDEPFKLTLHPDRLGDPLGWKKPSRIFVNSMSDLFHIDVPIDFIQEVWKVMANASQHSFQILTKRPEIMRQYLSLSVFEQLSNVWLGTSIENMNYLKRIDDLRKTPAAVRFISFEPLLDSVVDLWNRDGKDNLDLTGIHWVIVGCESGPSARPMAINSAREIRDECKRQGVAFFMKQMKIDGKLINDINKFPKDLKIREYPK